MNGNSAVKYGISKQNIVVSLFESGESTKTQTLFLGSLVKINHITGNNYLIVRVFDHDRNLSIWNNTLWFCPMSAILPVSPDLWEFLPAIISPIERVQFVQNTEMCKYLKTVRLNTVVRISHNGVLVSARVKYIGPVIEMGPGCFFGLELLGKNCDQGSCDGSFAENRYFICPKKAGLFVTAVNLIPRAVNNKPNCKTDHVSTERSDTNTKKQIDANSNVLNSVSKSDTLVNGLFNINGVSEKSSKTCSLVNTKVNALQNGNKSNAVKEDKDFILSRYSDKSRLINIDKKNLEEIFSDSLENSEIVQTTNNLKPREDTGSVENHLTVKSEKFEDIFTLEKKKTLFSDLLKGDHLNIKKHDTSKRQTIGGSLSTASVTDLTSVNKQKLSTKRKSLENINMQNKYTMQSNEMKTKIEDRKHSGNSKSEYAFDDQDVVMASDAYRNKTENEVDLIELLSGTWPSAAGDTIAPILNTSSRAVYERNKSANLISHLVNSKKKVPRPDAIPVLSHYEPEKQVSVSDVPSSGQCPLTNVVDTQSTSSPLYDTPEQRASPDDSEEALGVGSLVEVTTDVSDEPLYGVLRWVEGVPPHKTPLAGVELEEEHTHLPLVLTDGTHNGHRYFSCAPGRALFVSIDRCKVDSRFQELQDNDHMDENGKNFSNENKAFGQLESPVVEGAVPPLGMQMAEEMCGKYRGIQGHNNSCYLDATLFAMFACTPVLDSLLFRPRSQNDIERYDEVQRVLRDEIVNPLRRNRYVRADRVMKLRTLLEQLSNVTGLTSEEKDPEEFLNSLLAHVLRAEPFLKLSSGQEAFYHQLFVEKDERLQPPSVQQLFEQSFLASNIKLKEVPSCLIIQMPRFGKAYKMYPRIIPSQLLDVTDVIEDSPRQCTVCGHLAQYECVECLGQCGEGLESTAFCAKCRDVTHSSHANRRQHRPTALRIPHDYSIVAEHCPEGPPRLFMELFAVVCIETSHYVSFVKCGSGHEAPWCFFDSMADRKGEQNGYNIPEIVSCPGLAGWLGEDTSLSRAQHLPEHARRLLCDAYLCLYQSPDVMMYR